MTHLPYVTACYALGVAVPMAFAWDAWRRMRAADRTLDALDRRRARAGDTAR